MKRVFFHGTGADLAAGGALAPGAVGGGIDPDCELMCVWATRTHSDAIKWAVRAFRTARTGVSVSAQVYEVELFGEIVPDPNYDSDSSVMADGGRVIRRVASYSSREEAVAAELNLRMQGL